MEIPEGILKELKLSFTTKTAYEKDSVDAYIQELFLQIEDAKRAGNLKNKELADCKKKLKELEEVQLLEGAQTERYEELIAERDAANKALTGVKAQLSDTEGRLQEANDKIVALTEECEKYDEALARLQAAGAEEQATAAGENPELLEALRAAQEQIAALTKEKAETEVRLGDAYRELDTAREQLAKQPAAAETNPASNNMIDLFAEAQTFLNAAKDKATALTNDAQQQAAKMLQDAEMEAQRIRSAAQIDTAMQQQKAAGEITAMETILADVRAAVSKKLEEAAEIAAQEAAKLSAGQEIHT